MKQWIYLGVDQTGAVDRKGVPKPLPACLLIENQVRFFYLKSFTVTSIESELETKKLESLLICVDCVLGLPKEIKTSWREAINFTKDFNGYGRAPAKDFFRTLGCGQRPRRQVELDCNANSVFQETPFQKNIQTGTFRIWKDLNSAPGDFYAPAIETQHSPNQLPIFEGYPSLSWKLLLKSRHRNASAIKALLKIHHPEIKWNKKHQEHVNRDSNLSDAFLLALTMKQFRSEAFTSTPSPEGSIMGATKHK